MPVKSYTKLSYYLCIYVLDPNLYYIFSYHHPGHVANSKEGIENPPSDSSISRLLRTERRDDDGRKDYSIHGILSGSKGKLKQFHLFLNFCINYILHYIIPHQYHQNMVSL